MADVMTVFAGMTIAAMDRMPIGELMAWRDRAAQRAGTSRR